MFTLFHLFPTNTQRQAKEIAKLVRKLKEKDEKDGKGEEGAQEGGVGSYAALQTALQEATVKRTLLEESTDVLEQTMCTMLDDHQRAVTELHQVGSPVVLVVLVTFHCHIWSFFGVQ